ncbi:Hypothetical predicted protein [Octopus vulgaris]|uniref:Uncharacterized protein n=1 Tax=Octopus vulgaris TaxID=6645 RepID=A0AA36ALC5_OCTVU|nr:Hypothetical predicted protein [Octopus vulgaris]
MISAYEASTENPAVLQDSPMAVYKPIVNLLCHRISTGIKSSDAVQKRAKRSPFFLANTEASHHFRSWYSTHKAGIPLILRSVNRCIRVKDSHTKDVFLFRILPMAQRGWGRVPPSQIYHSQC